MKTITFPICEICSKIIDVPGMGFVFGSGIKDAVHYQSKEQYLLGRKQTKIAIHRQCFANHFDLSSADSEPGDDNKLRWNFGEPQE